MEPKTGKETNFKPHSMADILSRQIPPLKWIWESYIAEGDLFVFAAYMKVGKSTFIYPLVISVARGKPFLDRSTKGGGVLVLALEENPRDVALRLKKLGMTKQDPIYIHEGPLPNNKQELDAIKAFIEENQICLLVIDSLAYFWEVKNENDNAEVVRKLKPLLELARDSNVAIGLIHHESKYGGRSATGESHGDGRSIRGSSSLFGIVDQALLLDHRHGGSSNQRVLKAIGRRSESPRELIIELVGNPALSDPNPYYYKVLGTPVQVTLASTKDKVQKVLTAKDKDIKTIAAESTLAEKPTRTALDELFSEGKATRSGKGIKGNPYKYRQNASSPIQQDSIHSPGIGIPSIGKETNPNPQGGQNSILPQVGSIEGKETNSRNGKDNQTPTSGGADSVPPRTESQECLKG